MSRITRKTEKFNIGMTPDLFGDGISRIEHFDTFAGQARPHRELIVSPVFQNTHNRFIKFAKGASDFIYALCQNAINDYYSIIRWSTSNYRWELFQDFDAANAAYPVLHYYLGNLYGLWKGSNMWKMGISGSTGTFDGAYKSLAYTTSCDPITHSKDGLMYIVADNKLYSFDGTTLSSALITFPTNFIITSIAEKGDYINVVGYNSQTLISTSYLWDRDSSLATLTAKYEMGKEIVYHNASLSGILFTVSLKIDSGATSFTDKPKLVIRYVNGDELKSVNEYIFSAITMGGKYLFGDVLYFNAYIIPLTETVGHWVTFQLDSLGKLSIVQNVGINDSAGTNASHLGIIRDGDGFWIGGGADGVWSSTTTYGTISNFETTKYRSPNLTKSVDVVGTVVTFESLPTAGQVLIKTRKDEETAWTTIGTFTTDNSVKGSANNALIAGETAKERQFRVESTGGAVITGFQVDLDEKDDENYS